MNKKSIVIFSIIILLVVVGIATFFVLQKNNNNKDEKQSNTTNNTTSNNVENKETNNNETNKNDTSSKKSAVIYFSATGNTKQIAEYIKDETNSDIFEIIPKQKYTAEDIDYGENARAKIEQNDNNARPEIENKIDVSSYDVIFLGYPIWWDEAPKIILSFIDSTNLDGKTVAPFCTSGSSGISTSQQTLKSYKSSINWILGERFSSSSSKEEVKTWIDGLHLNLN